MGGGAAFRVESAGLAAIREELAQAFDALLTPQDRAGWRPHVTIQNKAARGEARALLGALEADFRPRALGIAGLASWRFRDGLWEAIGSYRFNRSRR